MPVGLSCLQSLRFLSCAKSAHRKAHSSIRQEAWHLVASPWRGIALIAFSVCAFCRHRNVATKAPLGQGGGVPPPSLRYPPPVLQASQCCVYSVQKSACVPAPACSRNATRCQASPPRPNPRHPCTTSRTLWCMGPWRSPLTPPPPSPPRGKGEQPKKVIHI